MELKTTTFKRKTGRHKGKWIVQITYYDATEERMKTIARSFNRRADAIDERPKLEKQVRATRGQIQKGSKMTFSDLVAYAKKTFYKPATFAKGRKVTGIRSTASTYSFMNTLGEFFGEMKLAQIGSEDLDRYKEWRFALGSRRGKEDGMKGAEIGFAVVNRELMICRALWRKAFGKGWVDADIFLGANVIDKAAEMPRRRTLSDAEESLLLSCTQGTRQIAYKWQRKGIQREVRAEIERHNPELLAMILLGLDSAMRRNEILTLDWSAIDFEGRTVRILSVHTKTQNERFTLLSKRTAEELRRLPNYGIPGRIFSVADFKRSWTTTKRLAGVEGLTFHDLRRSGITRIVQCGVPIEIARQIAGHAPQDVTSKHYIPASTEIVRDVADRIDARNDGGLTLARQLPQANTVPSIGYGTEDMVM